MTVPDRLMLLLLLLMLLCLLCSYGQHQCQKLEWYDDHGEEVPVNAEDEKSNVLVMDSLETMRRGDRRERSHALRKYLIDHLGENLFEVLYEFIVENNKQSPGEVDGLRRRIGEWLGKHRMHCLALVDQLVYYEETRD